MKDLLQISTSTIGTEKVNSVNTRDLYVELGLAKGQYSRWIKSNLLDIFILNQDFIEVRHDVEGNLVVSYIVTLDVAKHLCMMSKTENAMKIRQYFIESEKKLNITALPSAKELALMVVKAEEEKEALALENKKKSEFISNVVHSENSYTATQVAKDFNISAKLFNKILVEAGVQYYQNGSYSLTSRYQSHGLTSIKETSPREDGQTFISLRWTVSGKNWLKKNWENALQKCSRETFDEYNMQFLKNLPKIPMPKKADRNF
jgi:anti-repressor protein